MMNFVEAQSLSEQNDTRKFFQIFLPFPINYLPKEFNICLGVVPQVEQSEIEHQ